MELCRMPVVGRWASLSLKCSHRLEPHLFPTVTFPNPGYSESSTFKLPLLTRRTQHLPTRKTQYSMHHDVVAGAITESLTTIAKTTKPIPIFTLVDASLALPLQLETTHRRHFWHRR